MHPIQKEILYKLIIHTSLPYSKLKPETVEGNLFMYHIKQLINENLVCKNTEGFYQLTQYGLTYADSVSLKSLKPRIQPKIVTLIICQNEKDEYLFYKRKRQPFMGLIGFPYGKIHLGETIKDAANRELFEKTGLKAELTQKAHVYLTTYHEEDVFTQMFCHVFTGKNPTGDIIEHSEIGECFWGKLDNQNEKIYIPGVLEVLAMVKKNDVNLQFAEYSFSI